MLSEKAVSRIKLSFIFIVTVLLTVLISLVFFQNELRSIGVSIDQTLRVSDIAKVEAAISANAGQYGVSDRRDENELYVTPRATAAQKAKLIRTIGESVTMDSSGDAADVKTAVATIMERYQEVFDSIAAETFQEQVVSRRDDAPELVVYAEELLEASRDARGARLPVTYASDTGDASEYVRRLGYIPDYQKELFCELGWKVVVTDEDLHTKGSFTTGYDDDEELWGLCKYYEKTIYLKAGDGANGSSIIHEMGHFMDYVQGRVSYSNEFLEAYEADREAYEEKFWYAHLDQEQERYAEAYEAYYLTPTLLMEYCPNIYQYFAERL